MPDDTLQNHRKHLFPALALNYAEPIVVDRGEGVFLFDVDGTRYLDAFGGVLTISVGHANPRVVAAIVEQVKKFSHCSSLYANEPQSSLAKKLAEITPGRLSKSYFTSSGTEANETAIAAAKHATGRSTIVTLRHSYSGRTAAALDACGQSTWKNLPTQTPGFVHAHAPYCYRCPFHETYPQCGLACAEDLEELILTSTTGEIAAFMAETIIGSGGVIVPPPGYFERATAIARKYGGLFIADEVQTAWGRTGDHWFGIEHWQAEPDLLVSAKGMGNGTPVAFTIATPEVADKFPGLTFATFGGNPVSMAAARSTIDVIESEDLRTNARQVGSYLRAGLDKLQEQHELIGDVRGMGLMQGFELVTDRRRKTPAPAAARAVVEVAKQHGVLIGKGGIYSNVIRLGLPLIANTGHVDQLLVALDAALRTAPQE